MSKSLRIGHRGLEHRKVDDTYWLNGTLIDDQIYNQELQRIIAHQQVTDEAKLKRELQQQADMQNARNAQAKHAAFGNSALMNVVYGFAPIYRGGNNLPTIPRQVHEAMSVLEQQKAKAPAPRPKLSLKTTPLFGHLRYRFDSPFAPLHRWFIRWAWQFQRNQARTS